MGGRSSRYKKCSVRVPEEPPKSALMYALVLVLIHQHPSINLLKCLSKGIINSDYADSRGRGEKTEFSFYMDGGEGGGGAGELN